MTFRATLDKFIRRMFHSFMKFRNASLKTLFTEPYGKPRCSVRLPLSHYHLMVRNYSVAGINVISNDMVADYRQKIEENLSRDDNVD